VVSESEIGTHPCRMDLKSVMQSWREGGRRELLQRGTLSKELIKWDLLLDYRHQRFVICVVESSNP
jgi:hypothetical protein